MSAFLVEAETIGKIVTGLNGQIVKSDFLRERFEEELKTDFSDADWQGLLGQQMWDLNQIALGYRYGMRK